MMNFKIINIAGIFALASIFSACSDENHAGVLTETESGTTIAGIIINEQGHPATNARVSLISTTHVAARMVPIKTDTTDEDGKYTIDSISAGEYALQISNTEHTQSAYITLTIEDNKTNTQTLPETSLEENASLELDLSTYNLDKGDTLCITGTLNCIGVEESNIKSGTITLNEIPPAEFSNIVLIKGKSHDTTSKNVKWDFTPGEKLEVSSTQVTITIPKEALSEAQKLNGKKTLDSLIVPVSLKTDIKNPTLLSKDGDTLALYKVANDEYGDRYLTVIPSVNSGTYKFTVEPSDSLLRPQQVAKAYVETEANMSVTDSQYSNMIIAYSNSFGISFWIQEDGTNIKNTDSIFLKSNDNDVIYRLRTGNEPQELCANFYKRYSIDSTYTASYYVIKDSSCHTILDGKRHHFVMFVKLNHLVIAVDGKIVEDSNMQNAFINFPGFTVGNHKLEDLTVFSLGPNSIAQADDEGWERLHAWLNAFYMMQK
jgi:hypothetical protein